MYGVPQIQNGCSPFACQEKENPDLTSYDTEKWGYTENMKLPLEVCICIILTQIMYIRICMYAYMHYIYIYVFVCV